MQVDGMFIRLFETEAHLVDEHVLGDALGHQRVEELGAA